MIKQLIIIGSSGHFKVVINEVLKQNKFIVRKIVDIKNIGKKVKIGKKSLKINNYKKFNWLKITSQTFVFIAIGNNYLRKKIVKEIEKKNKQVKWATIISPTSIIGNNVKVKPGTLIVSGSVINSGTKIGKHCIINTSSSIDHDNYFDDYSSCAPGVVTGGNVKIGKFSFIGIRSTIVNNIKIGINTVVGARSLVNKNCLSNYLYFGSPAKKIKKIITKG